MKFTTDDGYVHTIDHVEELAHAVIGKGSGTVWARFADVKDAEDYERNTMRYVEVVETTPRSIPAAVNLIAADDGGKVHYFRRYDKNYWVRSGGSKFLESSILNDMGFDIITPLTEGTPI